MVSILVDDCLGLVLSHLGFEDLNRMVRLNRRFSRLITQRKDYLIALQVFRQVKKIYYRGYQPIDFYRTVFFDYQVTGCTQLAQLLIDDQPTLLQFEARSRSMIEKYFYEYHHRSFIIFLVGQGQVKLTSWLVEHVEPLFEAGDIYNGFCFSCKEGYLELAQHIWSLKDRPRYTASYWNRIVDQFIYGNHLSILQWIYSLIPETCQKNLEEAFYRSAEYSSLEIVQWLRELNPSLFQVNLHHIFQCAVPSNKLTLLEWLLSLDSSRLNFQNAVENADYNLTTFLWLLDQAKKIGRPIDLFCSRYYIITLYKSHDTEILNWLSHYDSRLAITPEDLEVIQSEDDEIMWIAHQAENGW